MKNILIGLCLFLLFDCKSQSIIGQNKAELYLNKTIEIFEKEKRKINVKSDFIFLSSIKFNDTILKDAKYCVGIAIMSSKSTNNLEYKETYNYKDFTVISKDTLNVFKSLLSSAPYKNINKNNVKGLMYNPFTVTFYLDKNGKIVYIYPDIYQNYYTE